MVGFCLVALFQVLTFLVCILPENIFLCVSSKYMQSCCSIPLGFLSTQFICDVPLCSWHYGLL